MKLKFINLLLAGCLLTGSAQVLTSCKDTNEDNYQTLNAEYQSLNKRVEQNAQLLQELKTKMESCQQNCLANVIKYLQDNHYVTQGDVTTYVANQLQNYSTTQEMNQAIQNALDAFEASNDFQQAVQNIFTNQSGQSPVASTIISAIAAGLSLDGYLTKEDLAGYVTSEQLQQAIQDAIAGLTPGTPSTPGLTEEQVTTIVNNILAGKNYATVQDITNALANYYTKEQVEAMIPSLEGYVKQADFNDLVKAYLADCTDYQNMLNMYNQINAALATLDASHNESIGKWFTYIEETLVNLQTTIDNLNIPDISELQATVSQHTTDIQEIKDAIEPWKTAIPQIAADASAALTQANANKTAIENLNSLVQGLTEKDSVLEQSIEDLKPLIKAAQDRADEAYKKAEENLTAANAYTDTAIENLKGGYEGTLKDLADELNNAFEMISGLDIAIINLKNEIFQLQAQINELMNLKDKVVELQNRISSIVLHATDNNIFGYFNTPLGITSNILVNYVGENTQTMTVEIPSGRSQFEYDKQAVITDADFAMLDQCDLKSESFASGEVLMFGREDNLGKVYFTMNPSNVDLNGKTIDLVNSQDKPSVVQLKNIRPSNTELTFGYTRTDASPNGFYEADATVDPDKAHQIRVTIDQDLKSAAFQILKERNAGKILALGNAVYNQFNGILPALGIRAAWEEEAGTQTVHSQYGIAATVFRPLSYEFFYGRSLRTIPMPDLGNLDFNLSTDGINIDLSSIKLNIDLTGVKFDVDLGLSCKISDIDPIKVTVDGIPSEFTADKDGTVTITKYESRVVDVPLDAVVNAINASLEQSFADLNKEAQEKIQAAFNTALSGIQDKINGAVNDMLSQVQQKIDESLEEVINSLQEQLNGKVDKLVNRFENNRMYKALENMLDRVNNVLKDPNHYLQATLLYNNNGTYGRMSNVKGFPSQFVINGGSAIRLVPTTFTGEVISPAYKKFVAITNVYQTGNDAKSAQNGDATALSLLKQANAQPMVNEVFDGDIRTVPFYFEGGQGYTYEIVYQALDYQGVTSTAKYYVSIK